MPPQSMPDSAMLLAAGLGKRMAPLTDHKPKPLIEIAGKPLIDHALDALVQAGIARVVVNTHYLADQVKAHMARRLKPQSLISDESEMRLETGGGIAKALPLIAREVFYVINSDIIWRDGTKPLLHRLAHMWDATRMDALLMLMPRAAATGYDGAGDYMLDDKHHIHTPGANMPGDYVFGGVQILHRRLFDRAPVGAFSLRRLFDKAEHDLRLYGLVHDGRWWHVGTPQAMALAQTELSKGNKGG